MAQTFVLIVQQPLDFKGQHYEPGDRLIADPFESAPLQRQRLTIEAPAEEQLAHDSAQRGTLLRTTAVSPVVTTLRRRGRPRKTQITDTPPETETPQTETADVGRYQRRDLQAEE